MLRILNYVLGHVNEVHQCNQIKISMSGVLSDGALDTWTMHSHNLANRVKPQLVVSYLEFKLA